MATEQDVITTDDQYIKFKKTLRYIRIHKYVGSNLCIITQDIFTDEQVVPDVIEFNNIIGLDFYLQESNSDDTFYENILCLGPGEFGDGLGVLQTGIVKYLDIGPIKEELESIDSIARSGKEMVNLLLVKIPDTSTGDLVYDEYGKVNDPDIVDIFESEYLNIREYVGGISSDAFYIRFGEPTAPNGAVAINCFVSGTMIKTDQGEMPIETVSRKNTIDGIKVYCVLTSTLKDKNDYYVLVKKDAFGKNRPNKDIISTKWHGIYIKDEDTEFVRIKDLADGKNIIKKPVVEPIRFYNICLKDVHHYMYANKLKVETLLPTETILPVYGN